MSNPKATYFSLYKKFLVLQIPNFIQIVSIFSLFGILINRPIFTAIISFLITVLFTAYLLESFHEFVYKQIIDPLSVINRHKLDDDVLMRKAKYYLILTVICINILINLIPKVYQVSQ